MRNLTRALVFAVGLFAIGQFSSPVRANNLMVGAFTLAHSAQWNGTTLPAGEYRFKLTRTQSDTNMLVITGEKQTLMVPVFAQAACDSCKNEALKVHVQGDIRVVTAMDLPGYHLEFKAPTMEASTKDAVANAASSAWTEQISVNVNGN